MAKLIDVDMNEYASATAPDRLSSGGLGPCIAVGAIYENLGHMIHYVPLQKFDEVPCINKFFQALERSVLDKRKLKIYVAGWQIVREQEDEDGILEMLIQERKTVLEKITGRGYKIDDVRWCPHGFGQVLTLNLSDNCAHYEEF